MYSDRWKQINTNEAVSYKLKFNLEGLPVCKLSITVVYIQRLGAKFRGNEVIMKLCGYCNNFSSLQKIQFFLASLNAQATELWFSSCFWAEMLGRAVDSEFTFTGASQHVCESVQPGECHGELCFNYRTQRRWKIKLHAFTNQSGGCYASSTACFKSAWS